MTTPYVYNELVYSTENIGEVGEVFEEM